MKLRIAPSPTGELHIGNARTALFNWLYARKNNGKFLLRIDDTDTERSTPEYIENIVQNLSWLGIDWDEGYELSDSNSYKQSDRFGRYEEIVNQLLENDFAYEDDGAVRFRVEKDKEIFFQDYVRGDMKFNTNDVEDFVILRSDKSPTYHLASTVDDIDYEITIIARGEDILSSFLEKLGVSNTHTVFPVSMRLGADVVARTNCRSFWWQPGGVTDLKMYDDYIHEYPYLSLD